MIARRNLLATGAAAALPLSARAQAWPSRPITLLVGFAPGGGTDLIARLLQTRLQEELGQPIAVENRTGASGTIAGAQLARSRADGYTMLMTTIGAAAVVPPQMTPPPYDILADQTPVVLTATVPLVVVVPAASPARTLAEFLDHARARPGQLNHSSSGAMTQTHLTALLLAQQAGISLQHISFRGTGQAVNEILAGRIDLATDTLPTYLAHIRAGRVRALATTLPARTEWLPDVPSVAESGFPGFDASVWYMLAGPPALPEAITRRWAAAVNTVLAEPGLRARVREAGFIPGGGTSTEAAALLRRDAATYAALIRQANIRME